VKYDPSVASIRDRQEYGAQGADLAKQRAKRIEDALADLRRTDAVSGINPASGQVQGRVDTILQEVSATPLNPFEREAICQVLAKSAGLTALTGNEIDARSLALAAVHVAMGSDEAGSGLPMYEPSLGVQMLARVIAKWDKGSELSIESAAKFGALLASNPLASDPEVSLMQGPLLSELASYKRGNDTVTEYVKGVFFNADAPLLSQLAPQDPNKVDAPLFHAFEEQVVKDQERYSEGFPKWYKANFDWFSKADAKKREYSLLLYSRPELTYGWKKLHEPLSAAMLRSLHEARRASFE
jgi:hypothetical protein